jgi:antitoxin component YwqK of YwqJK toxin-antitoxin module
MDSVNTPPKRGTRTAFWGVILVLVAGLWAFLDRMPQPSPPVTVEVSRAYLTLKHGRLYRGKESRPFTGVMTEHYPTGVMKSRSVISNGVLAGVSEGWHTNGVMQVREHFKQGVSDGVRTKWHANGRKASETTVVSGKLDGRFLRWDEEGRILESIEMKAGEPDGVSTAWYPSGFVKARARMANGKVVEQQSWKDGEMKDTAPPTGG